MGREEPLRISCDDCPGGPDCRDCLVEFFVGERDAQVVRFAGAQGEGPWAGLGLEPDLTQALDALAAAGLAPEVLARRRPGGAARAS
jgi:hypothetical protein